MRKLSHVDDEGHAAMVDVSHKPLQARTAVASGTISMSQHTVELIRENQIKKGDVLTVAQIAGIQAAKKTPELIPLSHTLSLGNIAVVLQLTESGVTATAKVTCIGQTGVEMEALTSVSIALLTVYDMCKAVDTNMRISEIHLVEKVKQDVEAH